VHIEVSRPAVKAPSREWRAALLLGAATITCGLAYSLIVAPAVEGYRGWEFPGDAWVFVAPARHILRAQIFWVYNGNPYFVYPPGVALVLAPVVALGGLLHLSDNLQDPSHPTLWLLLGPAGLALTVPLLRSARSLLRSLGVRERVVGVQAGLTVGFVLATAVIYGHYEELLAAGCLLASIRSSREHRSGRAALWLGAAILAKQWALFALPFVFLRTPRWRRLECLALSIGPLVAFSYFALVLDWSDARVALLDARSWTDHGHVALWSHPAALVGVPAGPFRLAQLVGGMLLVGWWVWRDRDVSRFLGVLAIALSVRLLLEPTVYSYYAALVVAFSILHAAATGRRWWIPLVWGVALELLFTIDSASPWWWATLFTLLVGVLAFPLRDIASIQSAVRRSATPVIAT
jgi:hypothetical protein